MILLEYQLICFPLNSIGPTGFFEMEEKISWHLTITNCSGLFCLFDTGSAINTNCTNWCEYFTVFFNLYINSFLLTLLNFHKVTRKRADLILSFL